MDQNSTRNVLVTGAEIEAGPGKNRRIVEVDVDRNAYSHGHVPGAILWEWDCQLRNPVTGEVIVRQEFEELMGASGITPDTEVVLYGDNNNWFACWAFWVLRLYGHGNVKVLDGGFRKWLKEGRPVSFDEGTAEPGTYTCQTCPSGLLATTEEVFAGIMQPGTYRILDVRSRAEYSGELTGPGPGMSSTCAMAGHIPTALSVPWNENCREDGTFKSVEELQAMYALLGVTPDKKVITYCAIGERASLTWFVLKELLGYDNVMNYDRSMAYWSRLPAPPVTIKSAA